MLVLSSVSKENFLVTLNRIFRFILKTLQTPLGAQNVCLPVLVERYVEKLRFDRVVRVEGHIDVSSMQDPQAVSVRGNGHIIDGGRCHLLQLASVSNSNISGSLANGLLSVVQATPLQRLQV